MLNAFRYAVALLALGLVPSFADSYPPTSPAPLQAPSTQTIVRQQVMKNSIIFVSNVDANNYARTPPNVWHLVDAGPWGVTDNAKWAFLQGLLIITHNGDPVIADLHVAVRRVGDTEAATCDTSGRYNGQVIATVASGGVRSPYSTYVPLVGRKFEFCWHAGQPGVYPAVSGLGINLHIQAWGE